MYVYDLVKKNPRCHMNWAKCVELLNVCSRTSLEPGAGWVLHNGDHMLPSSSVRPHALLVRLMSAFLNTTWAFFSHHNLNCSDGKDYFLPPSILRLSTHRMCWNFSGITRDMRQWHVGFMWNSVLFCFLSYFKVSVLISDMVNNARYNTHI